MEDSWDGIPVQSQMDIPDAQFKKTKSSAKDCMIRTNGDTTQITSLVI